MPFIITQKPLPAPETIELKTLAFKDWPVEAQNLARQALSTPSIMARFLEKPDIERLTYLAHKTEQLQAILSDDNDNSF